MLDKSRTARIPTRQRWHVRNRAAARTRERRQDSSRRPIVNFRRDRVRRGRDMPAVAILRQAERSHIRSCWHCQQDRTILRQKVVFRIERVAILPRKQLLGRAAIYRRRRPLNTDVFFITQGGK